MTYKTAIALAALSLMLLVSGCSGPRTVTEIKTLRVTVPSSLTEPVPVPRCPDCSTWGEAAELLLDTRAAAQTCNARLGAIRQWGKDDRATEP